MRETKSDRSEKNLVRKAILAYLDHVDSPLAHILDHIVNERKITQDLALVEEVLNALIKSETLKISGIYPHTMSTRDLDISLRRSCDSWKPGEGTC